ncbi:MAG: WXG100 family type VII secretion target [Acidobacteria bacterium]|nr:WXG100 family type VII secretion target [Acidobacteriota bacterium]
MVELRVGSDAVRAAGSRAQALMDELREGLSECDRMSASLVGQSWSGPASAMFQSGWAEWHRGASEVQAALAGIAKLLDESATQYEATESAVTQVSKDSSVSFGERAR